MSYEMNMTFNGEFIRVQLTAQDSYDASMKFFTELAEACEKFNCKKILVVSNSTPLKSMEAFDHFKILQKAGFTYSHYLAWVELNSEARDMDKFIENVLMNRAIIQVQVFSSEYDAEQWITGKQAINNSI